MYRSVLLRNLERRQSISASDKEDNPKEGAMNKLHDEARKVTTPPRHMNPLWRADRLRFVISDTSAEACKAFRSKEAIAAEKKEIAAARRKKAKDAIMAEYLRRTYDPAELRAVQARANKPPPEVDPLASITLPELMISKTAKKPKVDTGNRSDGPSSAAGTSRQQDQDQDQEKEPEKEQEKNQHDSGNEMDMAPDSDDVVTMVYEIITID